MPGRRIPSMLASYLGTCREPETPVEKVVEQCGFAKLMHDAGLTDYDPLVVVMNLVTEEVLGLNLSLKNPKARRVWCSALRRLQNENYLLEHNTFIPCRWCDQMFEPTIGEKLLKLFLAWRDSRKVDDFLAIHKCPKCGGQLTAKRVKTYEGDMHTPEPGSVESDAEWVRSFLQETWLV